MTELIDKLVNTNNSHNVKDIVDIVINSDFSDNDFACNIAISCLAIHNSDLEKHKESLLDFFKYAVSIEKDFKTAVQFEFMLNSLGLSDLLSQ